MDSNTSTANRSDHALFVHDAVWSIAMVLENSRAEMERWNRTLDGLSYGDLEALAIFYNETLKLDFDSPNLVIVALYGAVSRCFHFEPYPTSFAVSVLINPFTPNKLIKLKFPLQPHQ